MQKISITSLIFTMQFCVVKVRLMKDLVLVLYWVRSLTKIDSFSLAYECEWNLPIVQFLKDWVGLLNLVAGPCWVWKPTSLVSSVANAAVYLPNWAALKSSAAGQKLLGGWPKIGLLFIRLPAAALFSSNLPVSCQFREFLSLFNVQEHSFHQFQG